MLGEYSGLTAIILSTHPYIVPLPNKCISTFCEGLCYNWLK